MITISARLFGFALGTWHTKVGIDLPVLDFRPTIGPLQIEITTGPQTVTPPTHSKAMVAASPPNQHAAPAPSVDEFA